MSKQHYETLHTTHFNRTATYVCYCSADGDLTVCDVTKRTSISQTLPSHYVPHLVAFCDDAANAPDNILVMAVSSTQANNTEPYELIVWDHMKQRVHTSHTMRSPITGLAANRKWVVVAQRNTTTVHTLSTLHSFNTQATSNNPRGLCAVGANGPVVCLGQIPGSVLVLTPNTTYSHLIKAFPQEQIGYLCMDNSGTRIAVSNEHGNIVRIYDATSGKQVTEFRRGLSSATITSMCFDAHANWLCLFSDRNTVHLYGVGSDQQSFNKRSKLFLLSPFLPKYFTSSWSAANFSLENETSAIVGFQPDDNLCIVAKSGYCYIYNLVQPDEETVKDEGTIKPAIKLITRYMLPHLKK